MTDAVVLFLVSLVIGTMASAVLSHRLDQVGTSLGLSEGLLGLVTALASGQHDLGKSVILGSNIFNLASLLGLGALLAGRIVCSTETLLLNAGVSLWVTLVIAGQMALGLPPLYAGLLIDVVMLPYVIVSAMKPARVGRLAMPGPARSWLRRAVGDTEVDAGDERRPHPPSWADRLAILPLLAVVVLTSIGMVKAASALGGRWGVPEVVLGARPGHAHRCPQRGGGDPAGDAGARFRGGQRDLQQQQPEPARQRLPADAVPAGGRPLRRRG